ncbi:unnamed protein product [Prunus brigantina]
MPRCINNCYNLETFWKNWHASYNKWLVRYLYIPLGGTRRKLLNVWVVFTFVAIWHDLEWKLLSWAWLTCLFFIPETILKSAVNAFQVESTQWGVCCLRTKCSCWYYHYHLSHGSKPYWFCYWTIWH